MTISSFRFGLSSLLDMVQFLTDECSDFFSDAVDDVSLDNSLPLFDTKVRRSDVHVTDAESVHDLLATGQPSMVATKSAVRADSTNPELPAPTAARHVIFPTPSKKSFRAT
jgi:hypothetical protein